jgi:hypothetical protein
MGKRASISPILNGFITDFEIWHKSNGKTNQTKKIGAIGILQGQNDVLGTNLSILGVNFGKEMTSLTHQKGSEIKSTPVALPPMVWKRE